MIILNVRHRTRYTYAEPVSFGPHRMLMRPRDSHDLRLLETGLTITPSASVRWLHDVFGNSVAVAEFSEPGAELMVESRFRAEHYPLAEEAVTLEEYARHYPFSYDALEIPDIGRTVERHYSDAEHKVDAWARRFVEQQRDSDTMAILQAMTEAIPQEFSYNARDEMGTQDPLVTMDSGSGTCRDFALFMMEAARSLGFAARFVSGYLYDEERAGDGLLGGGATHAWVQIYLPGAGWVEFDPTNRLVGGRDLIRVAVARDPTQAIPLSGSFTGPTNAFQGMTVEVEITAGDQA
jgi:transglutaminase-like putative cysteine protease